MKFAIAWPEGPEHGFDDARATLLIVEVPYNDEVFYAPGARPQDVVQKIIGLAGERCNWKVTKPCALYDQPGNGIDGFWLAQTDFQDEEMLFTIARL